jgi:hypothetical protein
MAKDAELLIFGNTSFEGDCALDAGSAANLVCRAHDPTVS